MLVLVIISREVFELYLSKIKRNSIVYVNSFDSVEKLIIAYVT